MIFWYHPEEARLYICISSVKILFPVLIMCYIFLPIFSLAYSLQ